MRTGRSVAEVAHRVRSSIGRLCEHRMVPPDVCDAKQPVIGPSRVRRANPAAAAGEKLQRLELRNRGRRAFGGGAPKSASNCSNDWIAM